MHGSIHLGAIVPMPSISRLFRPFPPPCVAAPELVPKDLVSEPSLSPGEAVALGRLLRKCEQLAGMPVEIEWAMDESGFKLLPVFNWIMAVKIG